ncbi:glycosyltransferase family 4 protein [Fontibacter flavus]|uniref:Glycosyltransferase family 4 protein n=1 Tax=Fontibacter flavus TaxID=654838 RepID=A0ABV6FUE0_9BACT
MKIAFLLESFPNISETWLINQILDLKRRGFQVSIYSLYRSKSELIHEDVVRSGLLDKTWYFFIPKESNKLKVLRELLVFIFKNSGNFTFRKLNFGIKALASRKIEKLFFLNYLFQKELDESEIVHAHYGDQGIIACKMSKAGFLKKSKIVISFHGHDIFPYRLEYFKINYKIFNEFSNHLIVNSKYSFSLLKAIDDFKNVSILPVGLNTSKFKPVATFDSKVVRLVFVGRLIYLKGADFALDIMNKLRAEVEGIKLVIIGDGELKETIIQKIKNLKLENYVELLGSLTQQEVIAQLTRSDIFLYPARNDPFFKGSETQGLVIQEAQSMGLPVVCSDVGGIKYGLKDGITGFLVNEYDLDGFVEKLKFLVKNPLIRREMGDLGRKYIVENFDSKVLGEKLIGIYKNVLNDN